MADKEKMVSPVLDPADSTVSSSITHQAAHPSQQNAVENSDQLPGPPSIPDQLTTGTSISVDDNMDIVTAAAADANCSDMDEAVHNMIHLPDELWLHVLSYLPKKDLKNARLVKAAFAEFATKALFNSVVLSIEPANRRSLLLLANTERLTKYVKCLYVDTTTYHTLLSPEQYAKSASTYFGLVFAMGSQNTGPLSEGSLHTLLLSDPFKPLGHGFLCGKPRHAFCAGYALYTARSQYLQDHFTRKNRDLLNYFKQVTASFKNLDTVKSVPYWAESEDLYQKEFQLYLRRHLPQKTLDLIPGLDSNEKISGERHKPVVSAFAAPGVAARALNVMILPANHGVCYHDRQTHYITRAILCALRENKIKLETLSLPGPDYLGMDSDAKTRSGHVSISTLVGTIDPPNSSQRPGSLLLPSLRHLKVLELNVDCKQTLRPAMLPPAKDNNRLHHAIQQMDQLESLSLGAPIYLVGEPQSWNLTDLLLWKEVDYPEQEDDDIGPPPGLGGLFNMLLNIGSTVAGYPGAAGQGNPNPAPANSAGSTSQTAAPVNPSVAGSANIMAGGLGANILSQFMGGGFTSVDAQGNVIHQAVNPATLNTALPGAGSNEAEDVKTPSTPLVPNPWPKLRYLSLWNLPSSPEEIARLVKTVKGSLRTLKLSRVYFARPDVLVSPDDINNGLMDLALVPLAPAPANGLGTGPNGLVDEEEDEPIDMPDLIDMFGPPVVVSTSGSAQAAASATSSSNIATAPNLSHYMPSTLQPPSFPAPSQPNKLAEPDQDVNPSDTSEKWLSTIELLADELRLEACEIEFEGHDEGWLEDHLADVVTQLPEERLGRVVDRYLLEGEGMGFTLFMAQYEAIKEQNEAKKKRPEGGDGNEDEWDDEKPFVEGNLHICSIWQACPGAVRE